LPVDDDLRACAVHAELIQRRPRQVYGRAPAGAHRAGRAPRQLPDAIHLAAPPVGAPVCRDQVKLRSVYGRRLRGQHGVGVELVDMAGAPAHDFLIHTAGIERARDGVVLLLVVVEHEANALSRQAGQRQLRGRIVDRPSVLPSNQVLAGLGVVRLPGPTHRADHIIGAEPGLPAALGGL
jgi:hypothetical protein